MLLILGDWTRALWYLVFAIVSFKRGTIYTHTRVCQIAGYLIQMATEISGQTLAALSILCPSTDSRRLLCIIHIHTWRDADIQTASIHRRRRRSTVQIPPLDLRFHPACPSDLCVSSLCRSPRRRIPVSGRFLHPPHSSHLVSSCPRMDSAIVHLVHNSWAGHRNIHACSPRVQQLL